MKIRPLRDYSEHDVLNFFAFDLDSGDAGEFVQVDSSNGAELTDFHDTAAIGQQFGNTVGKRWTAPARVTHTASGEQALGMMLYDVREQDENGEQLIFNPQKAIEMNVVRSGEAVPILTRGVVLILSGAVVGDPVPGTNAFTAAAGEVGTDEGASGAGQVGVWLGARDANGDALLKVAL